MFWANTTATVERVALRASVMPGAEHQFDAPFPSPVARKHGTPHFSFISISVPGSCAKKKRGLVAHIFFRRFEAIPEVGTLSGQ